MSVLHKSPQTPPHQAPPASTPKGAQWEILQTSNSIRSHVLPHWLRLFSREPVVHFFAAGTLLWAARGLWTEDQRVIRVTAGVHSDVVRRFEEVHKRKPNEGELGDELSTWHRNEALYREGLKRGLDRDDPTIRQRVIAQVRTETGSRVQASTPSDADLKKYFAAYRKRYERPLRYNFEFLRFPFTDSQAPADTERELARAQLAITKGATPSLFGKLEQERNVTRKSLTRKAPSELAHRIPELPVRQWQSVTAVNALFLVRVNAVTGGMPSFEESRKRIERDWVRTERKKAVERLLDPLVQRYRFERETT